MNAVTKPPVITDSPKPDDRLDLGLAGLCVSVMAAIFSIAALTLAIVAVARP